MLDHPSYMCIVIYESNYRVWIELKIPWESAGAPVFQELLVGFGPRQWEIVYNGLSQVSFEKFQQFSTFRTQQVEVTLYYIFAFVSLSPLVQNPCFGMLQNKGLKIRMFVSMTNGYESIHLMYIKNE